VTFKNFCRRAEEKKRSGKRATGTETILAWLKEVIDGMGKALLDHAGHKPCKWSWQEK